MLYQSTFPQSIFSELANMQRQIEQLFDFEPSIRGIGRGSFPALNVGRTPQTMELYAFIPGLDPSSIDVSIENGMLAISGKRADDLTTNEEKATVHLNERFKGEFRRVITLSDDLDSDAVDARYRDGVLQISIKRRESAQQRRISVH